MALKYVTFNYPAQLLNCSVARSVSSIGSDCLDINLIYIITLMTQFSSTKQYTDLI